MPTEECIRIVTFDANKEFWYPVAGGEVFVTNVGFRSNAIAIVSHDGVDVGVIDEKARFVRLNGGMRIYFATFGNWGRPFAYLRARGYVKRYLKSFKEPQSPPKPGLSRERVSKPICRTID